MYYVGVEVVTTVSDEKSDNIAANRETSRSLNTNNDRKQIKEGTNACTLRMRTAIRAQDIQTVDVVY